MLAVSHKNALPTDGGLTEVAAATCSTRVRELAALTEKPAPPRVVDAIKGGDVKGDETDGNAHIPSLRVSISKVDEIAMLYSSSSARRTESSIAARTWRSSASGRFLTMVCRSCTRFSAIPRAVEGETRNTSSGANVMLEGERGWERQRVTQEVKGEQRGGVREPG